VNAPTALSRVLVVDDDPGLRRGYARALVRAGFDVVAAENGLDALARLGDRFDAILTDITMPELDGLTFLRRIRERDLDVPVLLMTSNPAVESAAQAVEHGAFRYLVKPIELDQLVDVVRLASRCHRLAQLKRAALEATGANDRLLGDRPSLESRFERALATVSVVFQPIVSWHARRVFAYEALVRYREPAFPAPPDLFDAALRLGRVHELGRLIRAAVARRAAAAPPDALLFVNVHPGELDDELLYAADAPLSAAAHRVVFEVTERASLDDVMGLRARMGRLRQLGYRVAVDDLGAGYAGLNSFAQLDPEFVKLDEGLVRGIDESPRVRSIVRALLDLCSRELGVAVISEGVETEAERDVLAAEGADLLQGYWFAKPQPEFVAPRLH
jgi:EAL domain-containing protein (putative c-di-GMP-specific phosphodiesterase class I)